MSFRHCVLAISPSLLTLKVIGTMLIFKQREGIELDVRRISDSSIYNRSPFYPEQRIVRANSRAYGEAIDRR